MEDAFDYVLEQVAKSALRTINLEEDEDGNMLFLMEHILIGLSGKENDDTIAARTFGYLLMRGYVLPEEDIKKMVMETKEKCGMKIFGLQIAYSSIEDYGCSGIEALAQIHQFL